MKTCDLRDEIYGAFDPCPNIMDFYLPMWFLIAVVIVLILSYFRGTMSVPSPNSAFAPNGEHLCYNRRLHSYTRPARDISATSSVMAARTAHTQGRLSRHESRMSQRTAGSRAAKTARAALSQGTLVRCLTSGDNLRT